MWQGNLFFYIAVASFLSIFLSLSIPLLPLYLFFSSLSYKYIYPLTLHWTIRMNGILEWPRLVEISSCNPSQTLLILNSGADRLAFLHADKHDLDPNTLSWRTQNRTVRERCQDPFFFSLFWTLATTGWSGVWVGNSE